MTVSTIDVLPAQASNSSNAPQETLDELASRILDVLANEPCVDVTEEAIISARSDLPRDKAARAEAIGGNLLSPIEPIGGGCRFYRIDARGDHC